MELGNDFGLVLLELAVAARTPLERLRVTKAHMDALMARDGAAQLCLHDRVLLELGEAGLRGDEIARAVERLEQSQEAHRHFGIDVPRRFVGDEQLRARDGAVRGSGRRYWAMSRRMPLSFCAGSK